MTTQFKVGDTVCFTFEHIKGETIAINGPMYGTIKAGPDPKDGKYNVQMHGPDWLPERVLIRALPENMELESFPVSGLEFGARDYLGESLYDETKDLQVKFFPGATAYSNYGFYGLIQPLYNNIDTIVAKVYVSKEDVSTDLAIEWTETAKGFRGQGFGRAAVYRAFEQMVAQGVTVMPLCPWSEHQLILNPYTKLYVFKLRIEAEKLVQSKLLEDMFGIKPDKGGSTMSPRTLH